MLVMPVLETERLRVREIELDDLDRLHDVLNRAWNEDTSLEQHRTYVEWSVRNYRALAELTQPPYGERAIVLRETDEIIGAVGLVPSMGPFSAIVPLDEPMAPATPAPGRTPLFNPEVGLYWAVDPSFQGKGYASEAARALIRYGFEELHLARMIAMTSYTNLASQGVMRKAGMRLYRYPYTDPPWFQVVGVIENPAA